MTRQEDISVQLVLGKIAHTNRILFRQVVAKWRMPNM